jgi:succinylglutamate desuccinylase
MDPQPQAPAVLVVAGTHGNERNAPWLLRHWQQQPQALDSAGLALELVIGNPAAFAANQRYLDRDLNRCFQPDLLADASTTGLELERARQLLACYRLRRHRRRAGSQADAERTDSSLQHIASHRRARKTGTP